METSPGPTVIEVDFKAKPAGDPARPAPPQAQPTPPVPFRKRASFLPVRFFNPKRLPPVAPPDEEGFVDGARGEARVPPGAAAAGEASMVREAGGGGTPGLLLLPPFPAEDAPAAPVGLTLLPAADDAVASDLPAPLTLEAVAEAAPAPIPAPAGFLVAAGGPDPVADGPASLPVPAPGTPPANVPVDLAPSSSPEPATTPAPVAPALAAEAAPRPDDERGAAVQITLSCEVTALRLTTSFRVGAVHLRTLSDVVSLRFVAPREAGNPLAAAVAFQIVHVELNPASRRLKSLLLKPLDQAREPVTPRPRLQVAGVGLVPGDEHRHAPITVTAATAHPSTPVQLFGTFHLSSIHFTPGFNVATLRLELASDAVLVRVNPSPLPTARDLPPAFHLAGAEIDTAGQLAGLLLTPGAIAAAGSL